MATDTLEKAKQQYKKATAPQKKILETVFGVEHFQPNIMEQVKTFEDACKLLKKDPKKVVSATDTKDEAAYKKLKIITAALNQGWKPNFLDSNEEKWVIWWEQTTKGFVLYYVRDWFTYTVVSPRLCFRFKQLAEYAAVQFKSIYNDYLNFK